LTDGANAAAERLNDILFKMTPNDLGNDILETDTINYSRDRFASTASSVDQDMMPSTPSAMSMFQSLYSSPSSKTPPSSKKKSKRYESMGDVAADAYKLRKGKPVGGGSGKCTSHSFCSSLVFSIVLFALFHVYTSCFMLKIIHLCWVVYSEI
jgi:hypothetical protein